MSTGRTRSVAWVLGCLALSAATTARAQTPPRERDTESARDADQVRERHRDASGGDVAVEALGSLAGTVVVGGVAALAGAGIGAATVYTPQCPGGGYACPNNYERNEANPMIGAIVGVSLAPLGAALGAWLAADLNGRHGNFGLALIGALLGSAVTAGITMLVLSSSPGLQEWGALPVALAGLTVPAGAVLALELGSPTIAVLPTGDLRGVALAFGGAM